MTTTDSTNTPARAPGTVPALVGFLSSLTSYPIWWLLWALRPAFRWYWTRQEDSYRRRVALRAIERHTVAGFHRRCWTGAWSKPNATAHGRGTPRTVEPVLGEEVRK